MLVLKKPLTIYGKQYQALDTIPDDLLPAQRVKTLLNVGHLTKANEGDVAECPNCERKFIKKTHNQKYCTKGCRKAK